jgi:hypothetical protein
MNIKTLIPTIPHPLTCTLTTTKKLSLCTNIITMITWKLYNNIHHGATNTYTNYMVKFLWVTSTIVPLQL